MWIARHGFFAQSNKPAFLQRAQGLIVERGLPQQFGCATGASSSPWLPATPPGAARVYAVSRSFGVAIGGPAGQKLFLPADCGAPDHLRQKAAHHGFDRAAVVGAHPARQLEHWSLRTGPSPTIASIGRIPLASLSSSRPTTVASADFSRNGTRTREPIPTRSANVSGTR